MPKNGSKKKEIKPLEKDTLPKEIGVHYIKTPAYRTYHVDGIFGGPTPSGKIYVEFFVQRQATPQIIRYGVTEDGSLGDEISREGKEGIVREIEAGIVMDIDMAKQFYDWLQRHINAANELIEKAKQKGEARCIK